MSASLDEDEENGSAEADAARDEMDGLWRRLDDREIGCVRHYAASRNVPGMLLSI